jgi:p-methyltransferase
LESIESELKSLKQTISTRHPNILNLFFTDDNVFSNQSRIQGICDTIVHSRINKLWAGFVRADQITSSNIDLIRTSGLSFSIVGVESGDQGQLLRMDKKNNLKKIRDGIELLDAAGIPTLMTFVVGFPGENKDTIANTAGFINGLQQKSGFLSYQLYPLHLSPLSLLASDKIRKQWKIKGMFSDWSHYTMNSTEVDIRLKTIFESAQDVNYHYPNESYFFLKRFSACDLKKLANLRNQLALLLMKKNPLNNIMPLFEEFARAFKLKPTYPSRSFLNQLTIRN